MKLRCCIFHLRDFHSCNNHTISAFCQDSGEAELVVFVLPRFLAHWTTAMVLNSVLPLIEQSRFLASAEEIKFFGTGAAWCTSSESKIPGEKIQTWCVALWWGFWHKKGVCSEQMNSAWITTLVNTFSDKDLSRLFKNDLVLVMLCTLTICSGWDESGWTCCPLRWVFCDSVSIGNASTLFPPLQVYRALLISTYPTPPLSI